MTIDEMKKWIDNANYFSLLQKWRSEPSGSPWFQGELGDYYSTVMARKRDVTPDGERVAASKAIGF